MSTSDKKLLVVCAAGLGSGAALEQGVTSIGGMPLQPLGGVFPAVTCTAQASFRTGRSAMVHGMIANGLMDRHFGQARFWEQAASLVSGPRIWDPFRQAGGRVGMCFWQQSLGESVDLVLTPAPIHKHGGGMVMDCACEPPALYGELKRRLRGFPLHRYWGPLASAGVGSWIARATVEILDREDCPELLMVYLPTLDYDLQRHGPDGPAAARAWTALQAQLEMVLDAAAKQGYRRLVFGDYVIVPVTGEVVYPNRALAEGGWLTTRAVGKRLYPDLNRSRAFAMVDHEVAHVYVRDARDIPQVGACLTALDGVEAVWGAEEKRAAGIDHPRSGELVVVAEEGRWLAYPWWKGAGQEPDYARHIDIHRKPGFDPCELFLGGFPPGVSQNAARIRGTHGRSGRPVALATDLPLAAVGDIAALGREVGRWMSGESV